MTIVIDGISIRNEKLEDLKNKINKLDKTLALVVIQVGDNDESNIYINQKKKIANELGVNLIHNKYQADISESELIKKINNLNNDENITGIILQLPLPKNLNRDKIINTISPYKDVDGLTNKNELLIPCTAKAIIDILNYYSIDVVNKKVAILGRGILVGKPVAELLTKLNAKVTVCHTETKDIKNITLESDIIISGIGKRHYLTSDMIKDRTIIIDAGISYIDGKVYGDADFENIKDKCSYISPVPKGVGPLTVYELFNNLYIASNHKNNL